MMERNIIIDDLPDLLSDEQREKRNELLREWWESLKPGSLAYYITHNRPGGE
jgi:murein L,D-transpeptidase YafK